MTRLPSRTACGWNAGAASLPVTVKSAAGTSSYQGGTGAFRLTIRLAPGINTIECGDRRPYTFRGEAYRRLGTTNRQLAREEYGQILLEQLAEVQ